MACALRPGCRSGSRPEVHRRLSSAFCAYSCPWSAAMRYQRTASASSCWTPLPFSYMTPRPTCPMASPCSAARRNQRTASASADAGCAAVPRGTGPMTTRTKKHEGNDEHEGDEEEQGEHDEQEGNEAAFAAGGGRTRIWCAGSSMTAAARDAERRIEARIAEQASSQNSPHRTHGWFFPRRRRSRIARCRPGHPSRDCQGNRDRARHPACGPHAGAKWGPCTDRGRIWSAPCNAPSAVGLPSPVCTRRISPHPANNPSLSAWSTAPREGVAGPGNENTPVQDDGPPASSQRAFSRVLPGSLSARPLVARSYLSGWSVPPPPSPLPAQSRPPRPVARTLRPSPAPRAVAFNGQARTRRPSASTAVAARARPPRGPRAGPSPPTTGETGCGRQPTAAAADKRLRPSSLSVYSNTNVVGTLRPTTV